MTEEPAKSLKPYGAPRPWEGYGFPFFFFIAFMAVALVLMYLGSVIA
ncbi:hypothetical protein [Achromobacter xylosoxidans]|nr:hypothetical protein [Achromobacter xylosoxidans]